MGALTAGPRLWAEGSEAEHRPSEAPPSPSNPKASPGFADPPAGVSVCSSVYSLVQQMPRQ